LLLRCRAVSERFLNVVVVVEEKRERVGMGGMSKGAWWEDGNMEREGDAVDVRERFDG